MKKKIEIRAAVLNKINHELELKKIYHDGNLLKNQVLVKIIYSGICGSQIGEISGIKGKDKYLPHLLGHEATGIIIDISPHSKNLKKNDKVILHWQRNFGADSKTPVYIDNKNKKINAGWVTTFNNYAVVSKNRLTKLPKKMSLQYGVLFGCALTTAYGTVFKDSKLNFKKKNKILITGGGMIGQSILFLIVSNGQEISILEKNIKKINFIKKTYPNINIIKSLNKINYYDYIYETTGSSKVIEKSYRAIKISGRLLLIGVPSSKTKISINTLEINYGKKIIGSYGGGVIPNKDISKIILHIKKKKLSINKLCEKVYKFNTINSVIKKLKSGKIIKKPIIKL
jgi:S-(hydroxymethyl)glutathione dehydrogenase/alcohol dehydrogenase